MSLVVHGSFTSPSGPERKISRMLAQLRESVERRVARGEPLALIEAELVDRAPLDEERRAALWLFAWHRAGAEAGGTGRLAA